MSENNTMPKFILSVRYDPNTHTEYKMKDIYKETRGILIDYGIEIPDKLDQPEIWLEFEDTFLHRRALKHVYMHILNKYVRIYGNHHDRKEGINAFIFDEELVKKKSDMIHKDRWRRDSMNVIYRNMFMLTKAKDITPVYIKPVAMADRKGQIYSVCSVGRFNVQKHKNEGWI